MLAMAEIITFKMNEKLKFNVRCEAERLLGQGFTIEEAARTIANEGRCSYRNALNQVQWVKVYQFSRFSKK